MGASEVAAGAAWLDENFPGWEREIDLGTLNLNDCQECICGQSLRKYVTDIVFSGYDFALSIIVGSTNDVWSNRFDALHWATEHGFYPKDQTSDEALWRELIKERFSSGNLSDN